MADLDKQDDAAATSVPASTHADALAHYREASQRPGIAAGGGSRNRACPQCRGVVPFAATSCPHCRVPLPEQRFDYFNYSDFEPDLDGRERRWLRYLFGLLILLILGSFVILWRCFL